MNNPLIRVQNLVYDYPGFRALNGISLTIESGTVITDNEKDFRRVRRLKVENWLK